mgnify:CR=1 FL=1
MTVTLNQIIEMENVLSTRRIPSDILKIAQSKRYSESKKKYVIIGDLPLHHALRSLIKEGLTNDTTNASH